MPKSYIKLKDKSGSETIHYSVFYNEIPDEFRRVAEAELNETEAKRKEYLPKLREITKGENLFFEDELLLAFLRNQKFNIKKAEARLKKFIPKWRQSMDKLMNIDMKKIDMIIEDMGFGVLPYRDKNGRVIFFTRPDGIRLENYTMDEAAIVLGITGLVLVKIPLTTITGFTYFGESRGESLHVFYPFFKTVKNFLPTLLSAPIRIRRIEVLNPLTIVRWFIKIVSPLLNNKFVERFCFHDGYESLHLLYDPNILPEEFGGNMGPLTSKAYKQMVLDCIKELKAQAS